MLLHVSSLPGDDGIGDFGDSALEWVDWLAEAGASTWQILPLGPTGYGASPYSALSSFAGNPLFVSLAGLVERRWLDPATLAERPDLPADRVDFVRTADWKWACLRSAWDRRGDVAPEELARLEAFRRAPEQADWLEEWVLYEALKRELGGVAWVDWPEPLRDRDEPALAEARLRLEEEINFQVFVQFVFHEQLQRLRRHAAARGIELLGDLPFYPALDSADVWSRREAFELDVRGRPGRIAGVPPDAFSDDGQLWGNPILDWQRLAEDGYAWWIDRLAANLRLVDRVRLDHFRGFVGYWAVPGGADTAAAGGWQPGPGEALFEAVARRLGDLPLVAEDLGEITDDVREFRRGLGLPGMRVLQFAFDDPKSEHLPHRISPDTVVYTGTHDNDTTHGWYRKLGRNERRRVLSYVGGPGREIHWSLLRVAMVCSAELAMVPAQDLLGLGSSARLNRPGRSGGQWTWRLQTLPGREVRERLRRLASVTERLSMPAGEGAVDESEVRSERGGSDTSPHD